MKRSRRKKHRFKLVHLLLIWAVIATALALCLIWVHDRDSLGFVMTLLMRFITAHSRALDDVALDFFVCCSRPWR